MNEKSNYIIIAINISTINYNKLSTIAVGIKTNKKFDP